MFARYATARGDPSKVDAAVEHIDVAARAAVEAEEGNRGFAVLADYEGGQVVGASYWDSAESMEASEARLADTRAATAAALDGELTIERFELVLGFRQSIPARGAVVRLTRFEMDPARADEAFSLLREETAPRIKGADGLCSFLTLLDREHRTGMVVTSWENQEAAEAFQPIAEQLRTRASDRIGIRFEPFHAFTMIRTTARID
jgi:quinol monooxygenase YgiN